MVACERPFAEGDQKILTLDRLVMLGCVAWSSVLPCSAWVYTSIKAKTFPASSRVTKITADLEKDPHAFALMFMQADEETKSEITASALPFKKKTEWAKTIQEGQTQLQQVGR